jgi:Spy/CpxP family protein refolding chaperone
MNLFRQTTLLAALAALSLSSLARAGGPAGRLTERLDLDAEQSAAITALFEEHRDYMSDGIEWRDADGNPNPEARAQVEAARRALDAEVRSILTAEQAEEYDALKARMERHKNHERRQHGMMRALSQLNLSDEQKDALRVMRAEHRSQRHRDREQFRADLERILTPEQLDELRAMREARRGRHHG